MNSSAKAPLSGYLYQIRYALLESVKKVKTLDRFDVYIEKDDDVAFYKDNGNNDIQQVKQHKQGHILSNASVDLWKTIGIWINILKSPDNTNDLSFYLVTTSEVSPNSAPFFLKTGCSRCIEQAMVELINTARTSQSIDNAKSYKAFNDLDLEMKRRLVSRIYVLGDNGNIIDLMNELKQELYYASPRGFIDSLVQRLEGWWNSRVIEMIHSEIDEPIRSVDIDAKIESLSDQLKQDNLPIDYELLNADINGSEYYDRIFVNQLNIIGIVNPSRILKAIRNYYFAFNQRTNWVTEHLINFDELVIYERTLIDEWDSRFQIMLDNLGESTAEEKMCEGAQQIYIWVETGDLAKIRSRVDEVNISRGSYQILSDSLKIGWHPKFRDRIRNLLDSREL